MAIALGDTLIFQSGHVASVIGGTAGTVWNAIVHCEEGTMTAIGLADADAVAQEATPAAQPAGAPNVGAEVAIIQSSTSETVQRGNQNWFVVGYFTTTAGGATVKAILQNAAKPNLRVAIPASAIRAFPTH